MPRKPIPVMVPLLSTPPKMSEAPDTSMPSKTPEIAPPTWLVTPPKISELRRTLMPLEPALVTVPALSIPPKMSELLTTSMPVNLPEIVPPS